MRKFIISGGPGAGKSTLLNALKAKGFYGSDEVSRQLIQEQRAANSPCLPWLDLPCFAQLTLQRMIAEYEKVPTHSGNAFFDRGIPDIMAYLRVGGLPVDTSVGRALRHYAYQPQVFMAPPWEAIYTNDTERWQTFAEAVALHGALVDTYQALNFTLIELPEVPVADRVAFVLDTISGYSEASDCAPNLPTSTGSSAAGRKRGITS